MIYTRSYIGVNSNNNKRKSKRKALLAAALVCACGFLSACKKAPEPLILSTPEASLDNAPMTPPALVSADDDMQLRISIPKSEQSADPYAAQSYRMRDLLDLVYETPVMLDTSGEPQPYLFETWEIQSDGSVRFTIRKNVRFHDGSTLDCGDIAQTLRKIRQDGENSLYAHVLREAASWQLSEDSMQMTITPINGPFALISALTFPVVCDTQNSGTGPYKVSAFGQGEGMLLSRNESWWRIAPKISAVHVHTLDSDAAQIDSFITGSLDIVYTRADNLAPYRNSNKHGAISVRSGTFEYIALNMREGRLASPRLRDAIRAAINKKDIIQNVYQSAAIPSDTPIAPDLWYYLPGQEDEYDPQAAAEILETLGYRDRNGDGFVEIPGQSEPYILTILTNSDLTTTIHKDAADRIARQLKAVGIQCNVAALEAEAFRQALDAGEFDIAYIGCELGADPLIKEFYTAGGSLNFSGYINAKIEPLLATLKNALTKQDYIAAMGDIQRTITDDPPILGVCFKGNTLLYSSGISGIGAVTASNIFVNIDEWTVTASSDAAGVNADE